MKDLIKDIVIAILIALLILTFYKTNHSKGKLYAANLMGK